MPEFWYFRLMDDIVPPAKSEDIYDCSNEGKPILHDTVIHLLVERDLRIGGGQGFGVFETSLKSDDHSESIQVSIFKERP